MGQLRQRIVLIHKLGKLGGAKKFLDRSLNRPNVHQHLRGDRFGVLNGHTLFHHTLHTGQTNAELILQQLAHATQTAVAQMVNIIRLMLAVHNLQEVTQKADNINLSQVTDITAGQTGISQLAINISLGLVIPNQAILPLKTANTVLQLLLHLVAAHVAQIITLMVKEKAKKQGTGGIHRGRFARTQTTVNFQQRLVHILGRVLFQSFGNGLMPVKKRQNFFISFITQGTD